MPQLLVRPGLALVPSAQARAPALRHGWWRYVERGHAHEVLARWQEADGTFRVDESSRDAPDARVDETHAVAAPWEASVARWQLECRLAMLGAYWQQSSTSAAWRRLGLPQGAPSPDPRPNAVIDAPHAPLLHHYHAEGIGGDTLVAALHGQASRFVVLRARLDVPSLEIGRIDVLHASAPEVMTRSLVLREQLGFLQQGSVKLVMRDDYLRAFGSGGDARAQRLVRRVVTRVREGALNRPEARPEESDIYREFLVTLNDPRLRALHARFMAPGEEERLLAGGAALVRRAVQAKRTTVVHTEQHLLTLLEASLLAREKMRTTSLTGGDPEVQALARLSYYL